MHANGEYTLMPAQERAWSVSVLTRKINNSLADFGPLLVQGELSQVKISGNGHLYATLKDNDASISLVMWRSTVVRQKDLPQEGTEVIVRGSLSVYAPRGQYQLTATSIKAVGQGDLAAQFEALKEKLSDEGLFEDEHKQELPFLPRAVGIVTASGSAALADMLHGLQERFPRMPIVHAPSQVQGSGAKQEIVAALTALDQHPDVDVIICGRGGGSLEDLWSFNEEAVVRAIFDCATPVISAVGHETDTTLADFVADVRAKTPTAAAEMAVPELADLYGQLGDFRDALYDELRQRIDEARYTWQSWAQHRALTGPAYQINFRRQRLDELSERMRLNMQQYILSARNDYRQHAQSLKMSSPISLQQRRKELLGYQLKQLQQSMRKQLDQAKQRLAADAGQLEALSPLAILHRGYAVVQDDNGKVIHDAAELEPGDQLTTRLEHGQVISEVKTINKK